MQKELFNGNLNLNQELGWQDIRTIFLNPCKVLILTHKNPDGDAVGSALGLMWILQKLGHTVNVIMPDDSPLFLKWLPGHHEICVHDRKSGGRIIPQLFTDCDLIICSDFNASERLGSVEPLYRQCTKPSLLIDHHPVSESFTKLQLVDSSKGSTSELIFLLIEKLQFVEYAGIEAATCLLAGIVTDTVGLQASCSYPEIYETIAALMRLGADKDRIYFEIYNMFSADRMRLLGYSLDKNMKVLPEFRSAYIALTIGELNSYRHKKGDTEGFVNYPLAIAGIVFSVLFTEQSDHIKLSLRSRGSFPANEFAQKYFNGGGHKNAAGGKFSGTMKEAIDRFESVLEEYRELLHADQ
ncbi:MAG: bifunctional oligoribonuclease/PAP phosphatase NrnA [Porphyromonadaceae bacterium]|nr:MAG: bifunctional oligoribonuclease/PAP phosphatase NrnA [Porphyromonadaceae bacterium]